MQLSESVRKWSWFAAWLLLSLRWWMAVGLDSNRRCNCPFSSLSFSWTFNLSLGRGEEVKEEKSDWGEKSRHRKQTNFSKSPLPQKARVLLMLVGRHVPAVVKTNLTCVGESSYVFIGQGDVSFMKPHKVRLKTDVQFCTRPVQADVHIFTWGEDMKKKPPFTNNATSKEA